MFNKSSYEDDNQINNMVFLNQISGSNSFVPSRVTTRPQSPNRQSMRLSMQNAMNVGKDYDDNDDDDNYKIN